LCNPKLKNATSHRRKPDSKQALYAFMQHLIKRNVMSTSNLTDRLPAVRKALHVVLAGLLLACSVATGTLARDHNDDDGWHHDNGKHKGWDKHHHEEDEGYERPVIVTPPPAVVIAPPPVYAPAPVLAVPPQINVVIPIR
jgi:hypothetical protein